MRVRLIGFGSIVHTLSAVALGLSSACGSLSAFINVPVGYDAQDVRGDNAPPANQGTSVGNGVRFAGSVDGVLESWDAAGTHFLIDDGTLGVRRLRIRLPGDTDCDAITYAPPITCAAGTIRVPDPMQIELATGSRVPGLQIPAGIYDAAHATLAPVTETSEGVPATVIANGRFEYQGTPYTFSLVLDLSKTLFFNSHGGTVLENGDDIGLILDVAQWFRDTDVGACIQRGDLIPGAGNHISIAKNSPCLLGRKISSNIRQSLVMTTITATE